MSFRVMQFAQMKIDSIEIENDVAKIHISHAIIIKTMDDAEEKTRWYAQATVKIDELLVHQGEIPPLPAIVSSADIKDNQITYRDESLIPINWHGSVGMTLNFEGSDKPLKLIGEDMQLDLDEHEKYIEHVKG